ncbi:MraW methylase family-domain-containing protein [Phascolomyces articulosus]|uniref:MraW methylase family-domain-containing protein n=1 Tax=Phascolomyces articulosus TaxID=60185 RepID=A0AAD5JYX2_9FUNG|nr:MraW methylase family-domain-containing protein [Phascolomyces articulosus]
MFLLTTKKNILYYATSTTLNRIRIHSSQWYSTTTAIPYTAIHKPVMLQQVLDYMTPRSGGTYCDLTFGDGGYTKALLDSTDCKVYAVDQDPTAYEKALQMADMDAYRGRLFPLLGRFGHIDQLLRDNDHHHDNQPFFDGMVMDIGVSSGQLETAMRGFSYKLDGPLDMRMFSRGKGVEPKTDQETTLLSRSISAYEVVNYYSREQIADIIYQYGGDRLSKKIASAIVAARQKSPLSTTTELAAVIQKACPQPRWQRGDDDMVRNSAARTFQAIRIYVNDELGELKSALRASEYLLHPQGRLVAVTFHSLEDKIVKSFMHHCAGRRSVKSSAVNQFSIKRAVNRQRRKYGEATSMAMGEIEEEQETLGEPSFTLCTKGVIQASKEEMEENSRSRSAKLRAAERTTAYPLEPFGPLE